MTDADRPEPAHRVSVWDGRRWHRLRVPRGANLRRALLAHGLSPYTRLTRRLNCGGRDLGVRLLPEKLVWGRRA